MGLNTGFGTNKRTGTTSTATKFYNPTALSALYGDYQNRLGQGDYIRNLILGGKGYAAPKAPGMSLNPAFLQWLSQNFGKMTGGGATPGGTTGGGTKYPPGYEPTKDAGPPVINKPDDLGMFLAPSKAPPPSPGVAYMRAGLPNQDEGGGPGPAPPIPGAHPTGGGTTGGVRTLPSGAKIASLPPPIPVPYTPPGDEWVTDEPTRGHAVLPPGTPVGGAVVPGARTPGGTSPAGGGLPPSGNWWEGMPDPFLTTPGSPGSETDPGGLLGGLFGLLNSPVSEEEKQASRQSGAEALQSAAASARADVARRAAMSGNAANLPGAMSALATGTSRAAGEQERQNEIDWAKEAERRKELGLAGLQGLYGVENAANLALLGQNLGLTTLRSGQDTSEAGQQDWSQKGAQGTLSGDFFTDLLKALGLGKGTGGGGTGGGGTGGGGSNAGKPGYTPKGNPALAGLPGYDEHGNPMGSNIPEGWSENEDLGSGYYTDPEGNTYGWDPDYGYIPLQFNEDYGWIPDQGTEGWPDEWYIPGDTGGDWWASPGGDDWGAYWPPDTDYGNTGWETYGWD